MKTEIMNGTKQRSSIWVGGIRKVDDIPWVMETYKNEEVGHHNSAVFVGPAISFEEWYIYRLYYITHLSFHT